MVSFARYARNALSIYKDNNPKYLIFFVTSRCNAKCVFCHYRSQIDDTQRKKHELSLSEIEKIAQNYGKISKLSFSGGEPFLREDLPEIVDAFIRYCDPQIVDIPTNGSIPDRIQSMVKRILPLMEGRILDIQLSIDGTKEVHDRIRGIPGLYQKILQTFELLSLLRNKHSALKIKMNLVYFAGNRDVTESLAREFEASYEFDRFQITYPHGESINDEITKNIDFDVFHELSRAIQKHYKTRNRGDLHSLIFRAVKLIRDDIIRENHILLQDMGAICRAGERILVLDDIGEVYPCEPLWESVGNVRQEDYSIHRVLRGQRMADFKQKHLGPGKCTCSWGCVALEKIIYSPSLYPRLLANCFYLLFAGGKGLRAS